MISSKKRLDPQPPPPPPQHIISNQYKIRLGAISKSEYSPFGTLKPFNLPNITKIGFNNKFIVPENCIHDPDAM